MNIKRFIINYKLNYFLYLDERVDSKARFQLSKISEKELESIVPPQLFIKEAGTPVKKIKSIKFKPIEIK